VAATGHNQIIQAIQVNQGGRIMKAQTKSFLAGILFTLVSGLLVWQAMRFNAPPLLVSAKAQDTYQLPTRGLACAIGNLQGGYAFALEGVIVGSSSKENYASVGVLTLDGQGGAALRLTQSYEGRITGPSALGGRYTLGDDCAGQLLFASGARFDFVSDNAGRELRLLQTNPTNVVYGTARKQ
jgi:hypothetical protein